jgi:hypothetical protein
MKHLLPLLLTVLTLTILTGCGQSGVSGKVTFKEDGSPLTSGTVVFQKPKFQSYGTLNANGEYTLSSYKPNDGTQKGDYTVYITGAESKPEKEGDIGKPLIDEKYASPESGITCKVSGRTVFNFTVEKPKADEKGKKK